MTCLLSWEGAGEEGWGGAGRRAGEEVVGFKLGSLAVLFLFLHVHVTTSNQHLDVFFDLLLARDHF